MWLVRRRLKRQLRECSSGLTDRWRNYQATLKFKPEVGLDEIVLSFVMVGSEYVRANFPIFIAALGPDMIFLTILTSVKRSGTHEAAEMTKAIENVAERLKIDETWRGKL